MVKQCMFSLNVSKCILFEISNKLLEERAVGAWLIGKICPTMKFVKGKGMMSDVYLFVGTKCSTIIIIEKVEYCDEN